MRDLNFQDSGCEPRRGLRAVLVVTARRGLRRLLRPIFARLAEILESLAARLDQAETGIDASQRRLDAVERSDAVLHQRTEGLTAHLAGLNEEFLSLVSEVQRLHVSQPRLDAAEARLGAAEARLDSAEWNVAVLHPRTEGLAAHLAGLSDDHRALYAEVQSRIVQLSALSDSMAQLGRRQDELGERFQTVHALHWDHVALARRLAAIEDLLSVTTPDASRDARPSIPFPGLDDDARARVG